MKTEYIFKSILITLLGTVSLNVMYYGGASYAAELGRTQRGGVNWGIGIHYFTYVFAAVLLAQTYVHYVTKVSALKVLTVSILIYTSLSFIFLGNNFGGNGWSYPCRYTYFMLCSYLVLISPLMKQLTSKSTWTK